MNRTIRSVLGYTREDFKWVLPVVAVLVVFCEILGFVAAHTGSAEDAPLLVLGILLGLTFLVNTILAIVYLSVQFPLFLAFPVTRRGLIAGILLHCLRLNALQIVIAFVVGTLDALARGALTGDALLPWQWMPWPVWPAVLLLPLWIGLFLGGLMQRFGAKGFWAAYLVFMLTTSTMSQWAHGVADLLALVPWQALAAAGFALLAGLTGLGLHWLGRAAVK